MVRNFFTKEVYKKPKVSCVSYQMKSKEIIEAVNTTHPGLGQPFLFNLLGAIAKKTVVNIAPSGCGKTRITEAVGGTLSPSMREESITKSSMRHLQRELENFPGVVIIDDMGKIDTPYSLVATISSLAGLSYDHEAGKSIGAYRFKVSNFQGSILLNVQPTIWKICVKADQWEAVIRDKTLRYYHLLRPTKANLTPIPPPDVRLKNHAVTIPQEILSSPEYHSLLTNFSYQNSEGRSLEHSTAYIKALTTLEDLDQPTTEIIAMLDQITRPMLVEAFLIMKSDFEAEREFFNGLQIVLTEFSTYGQSIPITVVAKNYGVTSRQIRRIVGKYPEYAYIKTNIMHPTKLTQQILNLIQSGGSPEELEKT